MILEIVKQPDQVVMSRGDLSLPEGTPLNLDLLSPAVLIVLGQVNQNNLLALVAVTPFQPAACCFAGESSFFVPEGTVSRDSKFFTSSSVHTEPFKIAR